MKFVFLFLWITSAAYGQNYTQILKDIRTTQQNYVNQGGARRHLRSFPESEWIDALSQKKKTLQELQKNLNLGSKNLTPEDPTKHFRLMPPKGLPGYRDLKMFINHPHYQDGKLQPGDDLQAQWIHFIRSAKKSIILNVYEFNLNEVADALIERARNKVSVEVGVDADVISKQEAVKKIILRLEAAGIKVHAVNSVRLNHQKMAAIDWETQRTAAVLFSSGNLTHSCSDPKGDLHELPDSVRPAFSVPNANHLITLKSYLIANLVRHELGKVFDLKLRGEEFPETATYQILGPGVSHKTLEAYPTPSILLTFSPGGARGNINRNLIRHIVEHPEAQGPIRVVQFAFSAKDVSDAIIRRSTEALLQGQSLDFLAVGETPFALAQWSQLLRLSGMQMNGNRYQERPREDLPEPYWKNIENIRSQIRIAPMLYSNRWWRFEGKSYRLSSKIHHKVLSSGPFAIIGTSFNFSEGADENNEQILVFRDPRLSKAVEGMTQWLIENSPRTVFEEALRKNTSR